MVGDWNGFAYVLTSFQHQGDGIDDLEIKDAALKAELKTLIDPFVAAVGYLAACLEAAATARSSRPANRPVMALISEGGRPAPFCLHSVLKRQLSFPTAGNELLTRQPAAMAVTLSKRV